VLNDGNNKNFTTNDYSVGIKFNGCIRNLLILNDTSIGTAPASCMATAFFASRSVGVPGTRWTKFWSPIPAGVSTPGEIRQQFGYIEIPLELEYSLIDSRFGLNIIGGGSSLFLDNNRVDLVSGNAKTKLGEATNINSTSFSTNIGVGMDYKLTDKFSISVEPIFKYQLNTFSNVNNVRPINFVVYSGLNFRF